MDVTHLIDKSSHTARLGFLLRDSVVYGLGSAVNKGLSLITFPLLARHFSVAEFGLIDLVNSYVVLATVLLVFGQDTAVARFFYDRTDNDYRRDVASQSLVVQLAIIFAVIPICLIWAMHWSQVKGRWELASLAILQAPFFVLVNFSQNIMKWTFRKWQFLALSVGSALGTVLGLLLAAARDDFTVERAFAVYLAIRVVFGVLGLWFVRESLVWPRNFVRVKEMLPFALPFGILGLLATVVPVLERMYVLKLVGADSLGVFAVGAKIASILALPIVAFEISWGPFSLALFRESNVDYTFDVVLRGLTFALTVIALTLAAFSDLLVVILGSIRYEGAGVIVFSLAMGMAIQAIGSVSAVGIIISKRSHLKLIGYLAMVVASVATIPLLGGWAGYVGVALASLVSLTCKTLAETMLSQQVYPLRLSYRQVSLFLAAAIVFGLVDTAFGDHCLFYQVRGVALGGAVVAVISGWRWLFGDVERAVIRQRIGDRLRVYLSF